MRRQPWLRERLAGAVHLRGGLRLRLHRHREGGGLGGRGVLGHEVEVDGDARDEDAQEELQRGRQVEEPHREEGGEEHGGGGGVHLDNGVGVLHDPAHEEAAEGKVDGDGPRHPVPPMEPAIQPRPVLVPGRGVVKAQADGIEERAEPVKLNVLEVQGVVVLLHQELSVHASCGAQECAKDAQEVSHSRGGQYTSLASADLASRGTSHEQQQRQPLNTRKIALEGDPEKETSCDDLQVTKNLVCRRVHVRHRVELYVVVEKVDDARDGEQHYRPPVKSHLCGLGIFGVLLVKQEAGQDELHELAHQRNGRYVIRIFPVLLRGLHEETL
mmetsp:Transcript_20055/g.43885  ORF Transcript_20055/g.43885 Transcript_20055/m.43885 type:complete len:328 (+) Transcript_20055:507-1490(+)